ncbi:MAG: hypothetical protein FWH27_10540 [Planctomycetaceae bacterium]|nr:hypothetical protein [Planctomycetaceae bacterium]
MKNKKKKNEQSQKDVLLGIKMTAVLFFIFLLTISLSSYFQKDLRKKILWNHYSVDQIQRENLMVISTRNQIEVSNGDILPQEIHWQFVCDLWSRILFVWLIIIALYFLFKKPIKAMFFRTAPSSSRVTTRGGKK